MAQRDVPFSVPAEIQRRLLPSAYADEAGPVTLAGWLEPSHDAGGDTFDYSLDREPLHLSVTDAMGHSTDAAMLATLVVGTHRKRRRALASPATNPYRADAVTLQPGDRLLVVTDGYVEGSAGRVDVDGMCASSLDRHSRQIVQELAYSVLDAAGRNLRDDATTFASIGTDQPAPGTLSAAPARLEPSADPAKLPLGVARRVRAREPAVCPHLGVRATTFEDGGARPAVHASYTCRAYAVVGIAMDPASLALEV